MALAQTDELSVIHFRQTWLKLTENWTMSQVVNLPSRIQKSVVCESVVNEDKFTLPRMYVRNRCSRLPYVLSGALSGHLYKEKCLMRMFIARAIKESRAQVVHSHFGTSGWLAGPVVDRMDRRHVVSFYGYDGTRLPKESPEWHARYLRLFETADRFLFEGPYFAKTLIELGCPEEKVVVQHIGVDVQSIDYRPRVWNGDRPLRVLLAGSFREKKGLPYALEALGYLQREQDVQVTIIGDGGSDEHSQKEKERILETIARHSLGDNVRMLGYRSHQELFEEAYRNDLFLSPSVTSSDGDTEGGAPVTIIEMAATGMPIVSSEHCDIPNVVPNGKCGLLAAERDVDGLVAHLRWLVANPDCWRDLIDAARNRVETEFNSGVQGQRLAGIYESLLS